MVDDPKIHEEIGGMRADIKNLCRSVDNLRGDMRSQHDSMNGRITDLEREDDKRKGSNARSAMIRGAILTLFGGSVGAVIISYLQIGKH